MKNQSMNALGSTLPALFSNSARTGRAARLKQVLPNSMPPGTVARALNGWRRRI